MTSTPIADIERWRETIAQTFVEFEIDSVDDEFRGAVESIDLGRDITLTEVITDRSNVVRTPALARDGRDDVLLLMQKSGQCMVASNSDRRVLVPGAGTLHRADAPYSLTFGSRATVLVLAFPRTVLSTNASMRSTNTGPIDAQNSGLRMLTALSEETARLSVALDPRLRDELGQTAVELLRAVIRPEDEAFSQMSGHTIYLAVRRSIQLRSRDPDFTIADAAASANVSLRYAQRLFEREGLAMSAFLRSRRLREAATLLESKNSAQSIEAVAHLSGFSEVNTFIRAFAREYGTTPAKWRRGQSN